MDEARRFLRYVIPGLSFVIQTTLLLWLLNPTGTQEKIAFLYSDKSFGLAISLLLGSGGLGFVFSVFHHSCLWGSEWKWLTGPVDYRELIKRLRGQNLLCFLDAQNGQSTKSEPDRFEAWAIVTALWHERIVTSKRTSKKIKSADPRADALANLVHSMGTARVASFFAASLAFVITPPECQDASRSIITFVTATILLIFHQGGYKRTGLVAQRVVEQVLTDALADEAYCNPVKTHVALTTKSGEPRGRTYIFPVKRKPDYH